MKDSDVKIILQRMNTRKQSCQHGASSWVCIFKTKATRGKTLNYESSVRILNLQKYLYGEWVWESSAASSLAFFSVNLDQRRTENEVEIKEKCTMSLFLLAKSQQGTKYFGFKKCIERERERERERRRERKGEREKEREREGEIHTHTHTHTHTHIHTHSIAISAVAGCFFN